MRSEARRLLADPLIELTDCPVDRSKSWTTKSSQDLQARRPRRCHVARRPEALRREQVMAKTKKPGKTEQVVALLRKRPHTVPEIAKRVGISVAHTRSILFALDGVKAERSPTRYSLKSTGAMND